MGPAVLALAAGLTLSPAAAGARSKGDVAIEKLAKEAERLYKAGEYTKSAETLLRALEVKPLPKLLFNVARTYDKGGDEENALRFYQRFIDVGQDPLLLRKASQAVERLRASRAAREAEEKKRQKEQAEQAEKARLDGEAALAAAAAAQAAAREAVLKAKEERSKVPGGPPVLAFAAVGIGAAGLGAGAVFGVLARDAKRDFDDEENLADKRMFMATAKRQALFADVALGVGGVAATAAVYLFLRGGSEGATPRPSATLGSGGTTIALAWDL
jgi:tetratricopeptide (TPR) repeat protein